jgi:peptide/nickel transport system permease protein
MFKRLLRSPTFDVAVGIILFWTFCAIFGYRIAPHDPTFQSTDILQSPSGKYPFGTDQIGRDVLSRTLAGARATMIIASCATIIFVTLGTALGLMLGYFRGWFDETTGRLIDAFLAIPGIIFLIAVIASLGTSIPTLIITIGLAFTPIVARTVRAAVLAEAGQDYVQAAKLRGERAPYILFVEILPNILPPIIVEGTVRLGYAIFTIAGITFLGLGLQPPNPDWSVDITAGFPNLNDTLHDGYYWTVLFPGLAIISLCVAVAMLADSLSQEMES